MSTLPPAARARNDTAVPAGRVHRPGDRPKCARRGCPNRLTPLGRDGGSAAALPAVSSLVTTVARRHGIRSQPATKVACLSAVVREVSSVMITEPVSAAVSALRSKWARSACAVRTPSCSRTSPVCSTAGPLAAGSEAPPPPHCEAAGYWRRIAHLPLHRNIANAMHLAQLIGAALKLALSWLPVMMHAPFASLAPALAPDAGAGSLPIERSPPESRHAEKATFRSGRGARSKIHHQLTDVVMRRLRALPGQARTAP